MFALTRLHRWFEQANDRWLEADRRITYRQWVNSRILAFLLLLIGPHIPRLGAVASVPEVLLDADLRYPAGALAYAPQYILITVSMLTVAAAALSLAGVRVRLFGTLTAGLLLLGNSALYAVEGKIVHHQWTAIAIAAMAWTLWSDRSTFSAAWSPRFVLAWLMAWGLSTSAIVKVRGGWLDPGFSAVRAEVEFQSVRQGRFTGPGELSRSLLGESVLWEVADYATIILEFALIVAVLRPALFRWCVLVLTVFHISILLLLGISFVGILPAYVPFVALYLPRTALGTRLVHAVAAVACVAAGAAVLASSPSVLGAAASVLPISGYLAAGLPLLLFPLLALWHLVRRPDALRQ